MNAEQELADEVAREYSDPTRAPQKLMTLGLITLYKWDKIYHKQQTQTAPLTVAEIAAIENSFSAADIRNYKRQAREALKNHHHTHSSRGWWSGVGQSVVGSLIYSFTLVVIALIIKVSGSDLITVLRSLFT